MADPLDVITLAEAKTALDMTTTAHDSEVALLITAISRRLDRLCGPIVQRQVTDVFNGAGSPVIVLRSPPVASIVSVSESGVVLTPSMYYLNAPAGLLYRSTSSPYGPPIWWRYGTQSITVTYVGGRFVSTATVDPLYKQAALLTLEHLWAQTAPTWAQSSTPFGPGPESAMVSPVAPWAVPRAVLELLGSEMLPPVVV